MLCCLDNPSLQILKAQGLLYLISSLRSTTITLHCTHVHTVYLAQLLARQWRKPDEPGREISPRVFRISSSSSTFSQYYDEIQELLKSMAGMDQLLPGTYYHTYLKVTILATVEFSDFSE